MIKVVEKFYLPNKVNFKTLLLAIMAKAKSELSKIVIRSLSLKKTVYEKILTNFEPFLRNLGYLHLYIS